MIMWRLSLVVACLCLTATTVQSFVLPTPTIAAVEAPPAVVIQQQQQQLLSAPVVVLPTSSSPLQEGITQYANTNLVSKKVSQEEINRKKTTFNLIFWGGGFVAPFLATIFYFGPKFWTK